MSAASTSLVAAALLAVGAVACSALFDDPVQCSLDSDCARFAAVCDPSAHVCVAPGTASGEPAASNPTNAPGDPSNPTLEPSTVDVSCNIPNKPSAVVPATELAPEVAGPTGEITGAVTLDCSKNWILRGRVFVRAGATLTITPGTTIRAEKASNAGIVVMQGGRLVAAGERDAPIVFTSDQAAPVPGDWRGVVILGKAPPASAATFKGEVTLPYGGAESNDSSGTLSFVRIEYGALGLELAGVGKGTKIDSVQVRKVADNCFSLTGGTVDAKHLVCQFPADEYFELQAGYAGRLQYLFGQKMPVGGTDHNGILTDASSPVIYNATLCGDSQTVPNYGLVVRNGSKLDLGNAVLTSWFSGIETRGAVAAPLGLRGTTVWGNAANPACLEAATVTDTALPTFDDDTGFDEVAWFREPARANSEADPGLVACSDALSPKPYPAAALTAGAVVPPNDGFFDSNAAYRGAFRDANDGWMRGSWARFDDK